MKGIAVFVVALIWAAEGGAQTPPPPATAPTPPAVTPATASQPISTGLGAIVYPAKGQSAAQQSVDEQECYNWAKGQLGYDPLAPAQPPAQTAAAAPPAETGPSGARLKGAARGAAAGAVIGEVANDDASEGAAVGAAAGAIAGGRQARKSKQQQQQQAQQQAQQQEAAAQAAQAEKKANFNKAFGACLQGRGYTTASN
jgi:hypothetical protein